ncbi:MAG: winged helix-turn-helix domain-containing protein [Legionellales bacterium]
MAARDYLIYIDNAPVDDSLKLYFAQFDLEIIQQQQLHVACTGQHLPCAILIHWSILKNEPQAISQFYNTYPAPLLIINDLPDEDVCTFVLESGADDYLTRPLQARELHARINAISRRVACTHQKTLREQDVLLFANWRLMPASRQVFNKHDQELQLSVGEYDLLLAFIQQPQRVLAREFLLHITKNSALNSFDRRVDIQISRLRQKIEADAKKPLLIKTVRNEGYIFTANVKRLNLALPPPID